MHPSGQIALERFFAAFDAGADGAAELARLADLITDGRVMPEEIAAALARFASSLELPRQRDALRRLMQRVSFADTGQSFAAYLTQSDSMQEAVRRQFAYSALSSDFVLTAFATAFNSGQPAVRELARLGELVAAGDLSADLLARKFVHFAEGLDPSSRLIFAELLEREPVGDRDQSFADFFVFDPSVSEALRQQFRLDVLGLGDAGGLYRTFVDGLPPHLLGRHGTMEDFADAFLYMHNHPQDGPLAARVDAVVAAVRALHRTDDIDVDGVNKTAADFTVALVMVDRQLGEMRAVGAGEQARFRRALDHDALVYLRDEVAAADSTLETDLGTIVDSGLPVGAPDLAGDLYRAIVDGLPMRLQAGTGTTEEFTEALNFLFDHPENNRLKDRIAGVVDAVRNAKIDAELTSQGLDEAAVAFAQSVIEVYRRLGERHGIGAQEQARLRKAIAREDLVYLRDEVASPDSLLKQRLGVVVEGGLVGGGQKSSRPSEDARRVAYDAASGTFSVINDAGEVFASTPPGARGWRPGQELAGYSVEVTAHGRYAYVRNGDVVPFAFAKLPASFEIAYNGRPWPPFPGLGRDEVVGETIKLAVIDLKTGGLTRDPDGKFIEFALPQDRLHKYDDRSGVATYDTDYDGIKILVNVRDYIGADGRPIERTPGADLQSTFDMFAALDVQRSAGSNWPKSMRSRLLRTSWHLASTDDWIYIQQGRSRAGPKANRFRQMQSLVTRREAWSSALCHQAMPSPQVQRLTPVIRSMTQRVLCRACCCLSAEIWLPRRVRKRRWQVVPRELSRNRTAKRAN